jgi:uncharacterized OB-fold protein
MGQIANAIPGEFIHIDVDPITQPFWDAAKEGRLTVPRCGHCSRFRMPPTPFCPACQSEAVEWIELSGKGNVYSYSICHRSPFPGQAPDMTYVPVIVELPDAPGVRINSNLVDIDVDEIRCGLPVQVLWGPIADDWCVPLFRPANAAKT